MVLGQRFALNWVLGRDCAAERVLGRGCAAELFSAAALRRMAVAHRTGQIPLTAREGKRMPRSSAKSVDEYLNELPPERRKAIAAVRKVIHDNLPDGYEEAVSWGMISYEITLSRYASTYNKQPLSYLALAAQKNYNAIYLMRVYGDKAQE